MRASGRDSFESWARARQQAMVRNAYLLTGDFQRAEDLVQEALIRFARESAFGTNEDLETTSVTLGIELTNTSKAKILHSV